MKNSGNRRGVCAQVRLAKIKWTSIHVEQLSLVYKDFFP